MSDYIWVIGFILSISIIFYHHFGYPLILRLITHKQKKRQNIMNVEERHYKPTKSDCDLPTISIIVPAFNEERWIAEKIRNLGSLDYPKNKLTVILALDGCTDKTAEIAQNTIQEAICADTLFIIHDNAINRGKVAIINSEMKYIDSEITVLTDTSALVSCDSLLLAALHFQKENVGVVNATYHILNTQNHGESSYWHYQSQLKYNESLIGSTIGSHGAFYSFKTNLFTPLEPDTINDDFILPMQIVLNGYAAIYEPRMLAIELEQSSDSTDFRRRLRISAGNMQQFLKLKKLLLPRYKGTAFSFLSGKVLRLTIPYFTILCLISTLLLSHYPIFQALSLVQITIYLIALISSLIPSFMLFKPFKLINYFVCGHIANLAGGLRYLFGYENGHWKRIN